MSLKKIQSYSEQLQAALERLQEALDEPESSLIRDASIKRFEFTYELSWKYMKHVLRYLGHKCVSPRTCIRTAAQAELIDDPESWLHYVNARNYTTHTYDEKKSKWVFAQIKDFPTIVKNLLAKTQSLIKDQTS